MTFIQQGRYAATIRKNNGGYYVIVTRDGDCLHGIPGRSYINAASAKTGARNMLRKAVQS